MRILWVKPGGLWPLNSGGRLRSFHIVSELSRRHRLTLLTTHAPGDDAAALVRHLPRCERVRSFPHAPPKWRSLRFPPALARSWLSRLPVDLWKYRVPALRREAGRILSRREVDLCVADFLCAVPNVPLAQSVPVVYFAHNVEHMIWKRLTRTGAPAWARPLLELEWRKMRAYEARTCRRVALTVAVSPHDSDLLSAIAPGAALCAVPTGVDTDYFKPTGAAETPESLVFTGSMDWHPNEDAILYFMDTILPGVRRGVPGVSLTVAGRNPSARLSRAAAQCDVHLTGAVDDIRPFVASASVYVVPLRIGGGTRLKIFEALAMGKAVVSTGIGAEGLPLTDGVHFLRADEPDAFVRAVTELLLSANRRRKLAEAGRRLVEERYSWPQVAREFEGQCSRALSRRFPGPACDTEPTVHAAT
jgi:glycosyltransferase involved in cell wall biosynthesis